MNKLGGRVRPVACALALVASSGLPAGAAMLKPGDPFPSWELTDHTGQKVSSQQLTGKTYLVWFYLKAQTPGCTAEGDGLRDNFAAFQAQQVEVLGISFDDPKANAEFVRAEKFPFRLLSDSDRTLALAVGAAQSRDQPLASRISYVVDGKGKVVKAYGQVVPLSHAQQVLADLPGAKN